MDQSAIEMTSQCSNTKKGNPLSSFNEKVQRGICHFLTSQYEIGGLSCNCVAGDRNAINITKIDIFKVITEVKCNSCNKVISTVYNQSAVGKTKIKNVSQLKEGDHIAWHRLSGHWHHAIYVGQEYTEGKQGQQNDAQRSLPSLEDFQSPELDESDCCSCCWPAGKETIHVIEYTPYERDVRLVQSVLYLKGSTVFRVDYDKCYDEEYTKHIAIEAWKSQVIGVEETAMSYDLIGENCEHFARRCKTGKSFSSQVESCRTRILHGFLLTMMRLVCLAIWVICEVLGNDKTTGATTEGPSNSTTKSPKNTRVELYLAAALSLLFSLVYCTYVIYRQCKEMYTKTPRQKYAPSSLPVSKKHKLPVSKKHKRCHCFIWYYCYCDKCSKDCCKVYGYTIFTVLIRELFASGLPVAAFTLFEQYCTTPTCADNRHLIAVYGFLVGLGTMLVSLLIGTVFGSLIVQLCYISCCNPSNNSTRNARSNRETPETMSLLCENERRQDDQAYP